MNNDLKVAPQSETPANTHKQKTLSKFLTTQNTSNAKDKINNIPQEVKRPKDKLQSSTSIIQAKK